LYFVVDPLGGLQLSFELSAAGALS